MKIIRIVIATAILIILNNNIALCQGVGTPVYDAKQDFWKQMDKIETKAYKMKDWLYSLEQIKFLRAQFMRMDTLRRATQGAYDLSNKIYENSKKVAALKNFGLDDAAFMVEKVIGMPIDPSYYMIRAKGEKYNKFVKAVGYSPAKDVDANAKEIYNFLLQYDPNSGAGEGGNQIEMFDEIAKNFLFEDDWRKMVQLQKARKMATFRSLIIEDIEKKKKAIKLLQTNGMISMTEKERLDAIEALRNSINSMLDSLDSQNATLGDALNKNFSKSVKNAVAKKYSDNWRNFIKKMRRSKVIGECHLREVDKSRRPITRIVYDWK